MATNDDWRIGYARQAAADFQTMEVLESLTSPALPSCQRLQFLQMACEKLVKAHLCGAGIDPLSLQSSHAYIAKNLILVLRQQPEFLSLTIAQARAIAVHAKLLAAEIEILAPSVDRGGSRPDNCEYPWLDSAAILHVPLDWSFLPASLLLSRHGRTIKKLIQLAISRMTK